MKNTVKSKSEWRMWEKHDRESKLLFNQLLFNFLTTQNETNSRRKTARFFFLFQLDLQFDVKNCENEWTGLKYSAKIQYKFFEM